MARSYILISFVVKSKNSPTTAAVWNLLMNLSPTCTSLICILSLNFPYSCVFSLSFTFRHNLQFCIFPSFSNKFSFNPSFQSFPPSTLLCFHWLSFTVSLILPSLFFLTFYFLSSAFFFFLFLLFILRVFLFLHFCSLLWFHSSCHAYFDSVLFVVVRHSQSTPNDRCVIGIKSRPLTSTVQSVARRLVPCVGSTRLTFPFLKACGMWQFQGLGHCVGRAHWYGRTSSASRWQSKRLYDIHLLLILH